MMAAQGKNLGGGDHRVSAKPSAAPTLAQAGIDKNLAHRARIAGGCHWVAPNLCSRCAPDLRHQAITDQ
jgi:hypothetical protein